MLNSEVLYLKRKFGQWQEDGKQQSKVNLEFYEYVEALKLAGDPSIPAGQVFSSSSLAINLILLPTIPMTADS